MSIFAIPKKTEMHKKGLTICRYIFVSLLLVILVNVPNLGAVSRPGNKSEFIIPALPVNTVINKVNSVMEPAMAAVYEAMGLSAAGLNRQVFEFAMIGFKKILEAGRIDNDRIISIIDFSKPSSEKRLFVIDLKSQKLLFKTYVAHGMNSGRELARYFSNTPESNKSSLGFYTTSDTYIGKHGYSLHLHGLEKGFNDKAFERDIVMHAADYVNETVIRNTGYAGRSWGCPAVPEKLSKSIIDQIKHGTCLFIYAPDRNYIRKSHLIKPIAVDIANS